MGKLYALKAAGLFILLFFYVHGGSAQDNLMVFKVEGRPVLKVDNTTKSLSKGSPIVTNSIVSVKANDHLLLINDAGNCFEIKKSGDYSYAQIKRIPAAADNSSFTQKYLSYVWNQFAKNTTTTSKTGVVYRNDNLILLQPSDSVKIYFPEIKFAWKLDSEENYFFLKEMETDKLVKFGVMGKNLTLFVDDHLLKKGNMYQWAVSETKFPDMDALTFYNFSLLSNEEFKSLEPDIELFKKDLQALGFNASEIKIMLCNDYKICY